ncbi:hypothetical protein EYZ11_013475 [Aspergillus tanneri]|uniref:AMP-dependent synthetase/ligase domain-containing protein n=1 Tax=Aspergillus tanneri TaxID=1220188 RepID=A0A4S3IXK4_9EURO|nr:hypothetical protein EYZ11_013475 [Aspergillus tanneri]
MDYITRMLEHPPKDIHSPVLVDADRPDRTLSWQEYSSAVKRIAVGLRDFGVRDRDAVALLSPNDIYFNVLGDGAIAAGGIFVPIPTFTRQSELASCITAAQVKWLVVVTEFQELALVTARSLGIDLSRVIMFDPPGLEPYDGPQRCFSELLKADGSLFQNPYKGRDPKTLACLRMFTSGTTGTTKAAELSHTCQVTRLDARDFVASPRDKGQFHMIGIFHPGGQITTSRACSGKLPLYLSNCDDAPTILDKIQSFGLSVTTLPPRTMEAIITTINAGVRSREALQSLNTIMVGGAPSRKEAVQEFAALLPSHTRLRSGYGSTEAGNICMTPEEADWIPGYVGFLSPKIELRIINPETLETLSFDTEGEICARSDQVFIGYCGNAAATESAFLPDPEGHWFRTGDKGYLDPKTGQLTVTGRFKEIFKVRYEEVAPEEIEHELMKHPSIMDAAVTSVVARDNDRDCECLAYVVREQGSQLTAQEVVDFIAANVSHHKAPTGGVVFCEGIPQTAMKKVIRRKLADLPALPGSARYIDISIANGK